MRGSEGKDTGIVDKNVHVTVAELKGSLRQGPNAGCIVKIGGNVVRFTSLRADFVDGLLAAFDAASYDQDMDAHLGQFLGRRSANSARSSGDQCCGSVGCHV